MKQVNTIQEARKFFRKLGKMNKRSYSITKACEELTELQEVLLKSLNKRGENRPSKEQITEEFGDVEMRLSIIKTKFGINRKSLNIRKIYKANKFIGYINAGEYKDGNI